MTKWIQLTILLLAAHLNAADFLQGKDAFMQGSMKNLALDSAGLLTLPVSENQGEFTSAVIDLGADNSARFVGYVTNLLPYTQVSLEYRASEQSFAANDVNIAWQKAVNGALLTPDGKRFWQYRITMSRAKGDNVPSVREVLISTETLAQKYRANAMKRKGFWDLTMMMLYSVTPEKLYHVYSQLPYDASERGLYIFRNAPGQIIGENYRYQPSENEMYLPMRHNTMILARIHPVATFSNLSLKPKDVILRTKAGLEKVGAREQHRSVNFFDRDFMKEYQTGLRAAVKYYRKNNPYVFGYTLMSPEFFYDTEPWPQMTYLSGFSPQAWSAYFEYMTQLGREVKAWPTASDGDILLDKDAYLWAYWRSRAGADYIALLARVIREEDPQALIGTMSYVGAQSLRGLEPGFVELNKDFDYYYSSNIYPRVPGKDGLDGGTTMSYTMLNVEGHSQKQNLLEYDLWSPYVDAQRAQTYARFAGIESIYPAPIVLGKFPDNTPSNHLTRYHGMKGSAVTPDLLKTLASYMDEAKKLHTSPKFSQVAVILPTMSLHALLEKDRWLPHRLQQQDLHLLQPLLELNVPFDLVTEGYATKELLDQYKLVIVFQVALYPWLRRALADTTADLLVLGWAGSVAAPGPIELLSPIDAKNFDFSLTHAWPRGENQQTTVFATGGKVIETATQIKFNAKDHPLLQGLNGKTILCDAPGLDGKALPYVGGLAGEALAADAEGKSVYSVKPDGKRKIIHFGGKLWQLDLSGNEKSLLSSADEKQFFANVMQYCGVEYTPDAGPLRWMRNRDFMVVENTGDTTYHGPLPAVINPAFKLPAVTVDIAPLSSTVIPLK